MHFVEETNLSFDIDSLIKATQLVLEKYPLSDQRRQLSFVSNRPEAQTINDGIGSLHDYSTHTWLQQEADFKYFNPEFQDTYFYEIYSRLQTWTENGIARLRLMSLPGRTCYSFHQDTTSRLHLAIKTEPGAFLIASDSLPIHVPANGMVYNVDTRRPHTAMNCSEHTRIHLVASLKESHTPFQSP